MTLNESEFEGEAIDMDSVKTAGNITMFSFHSNVRILKARMLQIIL